jgi:tagatose 1,6-diphosphate aldolase
MLKLPFPSAGQPGRPGADARARGACLALDAATRGIPWVLLGAGATAATFAWQLRLAGEAGASGFLVGRTIWIDALAASARASADAARRLGLVRLAEFEAIAASVCRPISVV